MNQYSQVNMETMVQIRYDIVSDMMCVTRWLPSRTSTRHSILCPAICSLSTQPESWRSYTSWGCHLQLAKSAPPQHLVQPGLLKLLLLLVQQMLGDHQEQLATLALCWLPQAHIAKRCAISALEHPIFSSMQKALKTIPPDQTRIGDIQILGCRCIAILDPSFKF